MTNYMRWHVWCLLAVIGLGSMLAGNPAYASLADNVLGVSSETESLTAEQAFQPSATIVDNNVVVTWDIADATYLYKHRFSLKSNNGIQLGDMIIPKGKQKYEDAFKDDPDLKGQVEIYHHQVSIVAPIVQGSGEFELVVRYQGCAERGLCYIPQKKRFTLNYLASETAINPKSEQQASSVVATEQSKTLDSVVGTLNSQPESEDSQGAAQQGEIDWVQVLIYFAIGIGLGFTPCVFPMFPILSSIIVGQGKNVSTRRAFVLSMSYVQGSAFIYAVIGLVTGLSGAMITQHFQKPSVIIGVAILLVVFAMAMFGLFQIKMPDRLNNRLNDISNKQKSGSLIGVFFMGAVASLVLSPCVTGPLMAIITQIAQQDSVVYGVISLYALALGMGTPLLLIGTGLGSALPRAGNWMNVVKHFFGFALLILAVYTLTPVAPEGGLFIGYGAILIVAAVVFGALHEAQTEGARVLKGVSLTVLVAGILFIYAGFQSTGLIAKSGGQSIVQTVGVVPDKLPVRKVYSVQDIEQVMTEARAEQKPLMLDFYADWCVACRNMDKKVFSDPRVIAALDGVMVLKADVTSNDLDDEKMLKHFSVLGLPMILFFDANGNEVFIMENGQRMAGEMHADEFISRIKATFKP